MSDVQLSQIALDYFERKAAECDTTGDQLAIILLGTIALYDLVGTLLDIGGGDK